MGNAKDRDSGHFRVGLAASSLGMFVSEDFDQDDVTGRYGNARDRRVVGKSRLARSKPRRYPGDNTAR